MNIAILSTAHIHTQSFLENLKKGADGRNACVIWDDSADRGKRYAEQFDSRYSDDLDAVLGDTRIDGFIICAENTRHLPLLEKTVPLGKPVFCEKPVVTTGEDLRRVKEILGKHRDTPLFCGYFQPFGSVMRGAGRLVSDGAFGTITRVRYRNAHHAAYGRWFDSGDLRWFTDPELSGGGAFMDMGTHAIHLLRTFFGPVNRVWASIRNEAGIYPEVDDYGIAHLEFESGVMGTVEASWTQTGGIGGLEISGSERSLWNTGKGYVTGKPKEDPAPVEPADERPTRVDRLVAVIQGRIPQEELDSDLAAILDSVTIMEAAYRSSAAGTWIDVVE